MDGGAIRCQNILGSGCGSVGRVVAFDSRGPRFNSSHRENFIEHLFIINCIEKTKINKKRPGMAHFFIKKIIIKKISWSDQTFTTGYLHTDLGMLGSHKWSSVSIGLVKCLH